MKLYEMRDRQSFGFSAENPSGSKGGGTRGETARSCGLVSTFSLGKPSRSAKPRDPA